MPLLACSLFSANVYLQLKYSWRVWIEALSASYLVYHTPTLNLIGRTNIGTPLPGMKISEVCSQSAPNSAHCVLAVKRIAGEDRF